MSTLALAPLVRRVELDRLRGLAILLMIGDHLARVWAFEGYRLTLGRLAMPLFFVVAGHLAGSRLSVRHLYALCLGLALPLLVPWVDSPNVLVWFSIGAVILYVFDQRGWPTWVLIFPALIFAANGWVFGLWPHSYEPFSLLALMAVGRGLGGEAFVAGRTLPAWVGALGRRPLTWYVGHLLALQLVLVAVGRG
jgi:hypothetical protein